MSITLNDNLNIKTPKPTRTTDVVGDGQMYATKDLIPVGIRYNGMTTFDGTNKWILKLGVWVADDSTLPDNVLINDGSVQMETTVPVEEGDRYTTNTWSTTYVKLIGDVRTFTNGDNIALLDWSGVAIGYKVIQRISYYTTTTQLTYTIPFDDIPPVIYKVVKIDSPPTYYYPEELQDIATKRYVLDNTAKFTEERTTGVTVGGITSGTVIAADTSLEDILIDMLIPDRVTVLNYTGYSSPLEVNTDIVNPVFSWTVGGTPTNLVLNDTEEQLVNQAVTGTSYTSSETYTLDDYGSITWVLSGSNVASTQKTTYFVHPSYMGKNTTGDTPTNSEILAEDKLIVQTTSSISVSPNTDVTEYAWIAVPKLQTNHLYTQWYVTDFNSGSIDNGNFIEYKGEVTVGTVIYYVYMFGNAIDFTDTLKLS